MYEKSQFKLNMYGGFTTLPWTREIALLPSIHLWFSFFLFPQGNKKATAAIATESKGRPGRACHLQSILIGWSPLSELCCCVDGEADSSLSVAVDAELSQQSCQGEFTPQAKGWVLLSCYTFSGWISGVSVIDLCLNADLMIEKICSAFSELGQTKYFHPFSVHIINKVLNIVRNRKPVPGVQFCP